MKNLNSFTQSRSMEPWWGWLSALLLALMISGTTHAQLSSIPMQGDVCWKDSYGRGVGTIPDTCNNRTKEGLLCYDKCPNGGSNVGGTCWSNCPRGTRDIGATCVKEDISSYGRGAGYPIWDEGRCNADNSTDWNDNIDAFKVWENTEVTVYEHPNFQGKSLYFKGPQTVALPAEWQNRISSVKIRALRSPSAFVTEADIAKLNDDVKKMLERRLAGDVSAALTAQIDTARRSIATMEASLRTVPPGMDLKEGSYFLRPATEEKACFYDKNDYQGYEFCLKDGEELQLKDRLKWQTSVNWKNEIMSVKIGTGLRAMAYWNDGYTGDQRPFDSGPGGGGWWNYLGTYNGKGWSNQIASIRVARQSPKVCFYNRIDELGSTQFRLCANADRDMKTLPNEGGCEKNGALYYPKCRANYSGAGPVCWSTTKCDGGTTDAGFFCTKDSKVMQPYSAACPSNKGDDAGLCYENCRSGTKGVGPVCWGSCPSNYPVDCGAMCGKSTGDCVRQITGQVFAGLDVVSTIVGGVVSGGATVAAKTAAMVAIKSALKTVAKDVTKSAALEALRASGSKMTTAQNEELAKALGGEDFDPASLDPTGIAALVNSFRKPICNASPAASATPVATPVPTPAVVSFANIKLQTNHPAPNAMCIDIDRANDKSPVLWQCHGEANQRFTIDTAKSVVRYKDRCMTMVALPAAQSEGGQLAAISFNACDNSVAQRWTATAQGQLKHESGKCADIAKMRNDNGAPIGAWPCHGGTNQSWKPAQ